MYLYIGKNSVIREDNIIRNIQSGKNRKLSRISKIIWRSGNKEKNRRYFM